MKSVTIRIPDSLRKEIRKLAGAADKSMNQWIIDTLRRAIANR